MWEMSYNKFGKEGKIFLFIIGIVFSLAAIILLIFGIGEDGIQVFTFWEYDVVLGILVAVAVSALIAGLKK